ncbi:uncharacterized protein NPIL_299631 [Nephila pilipes]|uniref:Uncharacterized protein n=1 Tax=Nephila pilipes TaxID=299642 RepID=A0A8X6T6Z8_NEPPI|nr:uncharacterized protein NPIL_299631 [Nephila pilipes]
MGDVKAQLFADDLYLYLFHQTKLIEKLPCSYKSQKSEFREEIGRAVLYFMHSYHDLSKRFLQSFLDDIMKSKENFILYLKLYCSSHHSNQHIFDKFLIVCSFLLEMTLFCRSKGDSGFIFFAPMCWVEFFDEELRGEFYLEGGWQELISHIKTKGYDSLSKNMILKMNHFWIAYEIEEKFSELSKDASVQECIYSNEKEIHENVLGEGNSSEFNNQEKGTLHLKKSFNSGDSALESTL